MNRPSDQPLDPNSARGREITERLTAFLAEMRLRIAARQTLPEPARKAA